MNSMVNGERLDVRIVTSTGADSYALGYSEAEFRRLKFQGEYLRDFAHLVASHAERRDRGSAEPQSARVPRTVGVVGDDVAVQRDPGRAARGLGLSSVETEVTDIDEHEMVVRSAGHDRNTRGHQRVGEDPRVVDDRRRVLAERRL